MSRTIEEINAKIQSGKVVVFTAEEIIDVVKEKRTMPGCTACVPHCPTQALDVDRDSWNVSFDPEKCIVCFSCLETCIYSAMSVEDQFA